jgi:crotonobetainyl-CoA:carnitine CoA-transferase CaiB-like acyl-CoA transferase
MGGDISIMHQHSNRGKQSLGLDLGTPDGLAVLHKLVATADVFVTNKLGRVRRKLHIDVDDMRAHNPNLIYLRGSGQGERGAEADRGSYDMLSFWHRSGASVGAISPEGEVPFLPGPGFGDSLGAMTIAGGIMGALYHRAMTGEALVVDVSLLGVGMWAMGPAIAISGLTGEWNWPPPGRNPMSQIYRTKDDRWLALCCLQAGHYWPIFCETVGRSDLAADPRFADHATIVANNDQAMAELAKVFETQTIDEWRETLCDFPGQWTVVQNVMETGHDPQALANGFVQQCSTEAGEPFTLVAGPVQFGSEPSQPRRAPDFHEQGDAILQDIGFDWDTIIDLKARGIVA